MGAQATAPECRMAPHNFAFASSLAFAALAAVAQPAGLEVQLERCRALTEAGARLTCYDAMAPSRTVPVAAAPSAVTPSPPGVAAERFGLPERERQSNEQRIESRVGDDFFGWGPNERIRLANGQVWQVTDGSSGAIGAPNRKVVVRRGALGSFLLEFEGQNHSVRVRRVE
jgi:hypothetical protein